MALNKVMRGISVYAIKAKNGYLTVKKTISEKINGDVMVFIDKIDVEQYIFHLNQQRKFGFRYELINRY